jgi:hypothetical protein
MMLIRTVLNAVLTLFAATAFAQQAPIFDLDDNVDPRGAPGKFFASRIVAGGTWNADDDYRPLHRNLGFVHLANSFYWSTFQLNYKHTESRASGTPAPVSACECFPTPIYFPTPPSRDSTPAAPVPGRKETAQFGWYGLESGPPDERVMLRFQLTLTRQPIHTAVTSLTTEQVTRRDGHEQSFGVDADTYVPLARGGLFGSLSFARTARSGTTDDRVQNELTYTNRFPVVSAGPLLLRAMLTIGGVSGRGVTGLNIVNPYFEAFWHHAASKTNFHLVLSPQSMRSGSGGWETHPQVALFVDRPLFVKLFAHIARGS